MKKIACLLGIAILVFTLGCTNSTEKKDVTADTLKKDTVIVDTVKKAVVDTVKVEEVNPVKK